MKWKRMLQAVAVLIGLFVVVFLIANQLVGIGSVAPVVDLARSKCVKDGKVMRLLVINARSTVPPVRTTITPHVPEPNAP